MGGIGLSFNRKDCKVLKNLAVLPKKIYILIFILYLYAVIYSTMKKLFFKTLFFIFVFSSFAFSQSEPAQPNPLFQLSAGSVYSCIDLSRYTNSAVYRGLHCRVVTHLGGLFFVSTEYSTFPVHTSPVAWDNIHTRKFDVNGHVSFSTNNNLTHIFVLAGANRHEWKARRTGFTDMDQHASGIAEGTYVNIKRWGVNVGCGFTHSLYENIGVFADYRFCFANAENFEKVRIVDVMTTIGINYAIQHPLKSNGKKKSGIGKKIYKWTRKGAK